MNASNYKLILFVSFW